MSPLPAKKPPSHLGCLLVIAVSTLAGALFALVFGLYWLRTRGWPSAKPTILGGLCLAVFGVAFLIAGLFVSRRQRRLAAFRAAHPDEPWLWQRKWANGQIWDRNPAIIFVAWIMTLPFVAFGATMIVQSLSRHRQEWIPLIMGIAFGLCGLWMLIWALRLTVQRLKYGASRLELATFPGVIGGQLVGIVHIRRVVAPPKGFQASLRCHHLTTTHSGEDRHINRNVIWDQEIHIARSIDGAASPTAIPIAFAIPATCEPWRDYDGQTGIEWELQVKAATPGIDYSATFQVPVFITPDSRDDATPAVDPIAAYRMAPPPEAIQSRGVRITQSPAETIFYFSPLRMPVAGVTLTVFGLLSGGAGVLLWKHFHMLVCIAGIFFGILMLWGGIHVLFEAVHLVFTPSGITLRHSTLGWARTRRFDPADVIGFVSTNNASRESADGTISYFQLRLETRAEKPCRIAGGIVGRQRVDALIAQMQEALARCRPTPLVSPAASSQKQLS